MKNLISLGVFLLILFSVQVNAQEQSVLKIRDKGKKDRNGENRRIDPLGSR